MKHSSALSMHGLCRDGPSPAAQCRTRADLALPPHAVATGRLQLPPSADLLGLWRRGDRAIRIVGRRMDDAGAAVALPALGHVGHRQCAAGTRRPARAGICPGATAAGAASTRQLGSLHRFQAKRALQPRGNSGRTRIDLMLPQGGRQRCAGKSATTITIPDRSICWPCSHCSSSSSPLPLFHARPEPEHHGLHRAEPERAVVRLRQTRASARTRRSRRAAARSAPVAAALSGAAAVAAAHRPTASAHAPNRHRATSPPAAGSIHAMRQR